VILTLAQATATHLEKRWAVVGAISERPVFHEAKHIRNIATAEQRQFWNIQAFGQLLGIAEEAGKPFPISHQTNILPGHGKQDLIEMLAVCHAQRGIQANRTRTVQSRLPISAAIQAKSGI